MPRATPCSTMGGASRAEGLMRSGRRSADLPDGAAADGDPAPRERDEDAGEHDGSDALAVARDSLEEGDHREDCGDDGKAAAQYQPDEQWDGHEHETGQREPERGPGSRVGTAFDGGGHASIIPRSASPPNAADACGRRPSRWWDPEDCRCVVTVRS